MSLKTKVEKVIDKFDKRVDEVIEENKKCKSYDKRDRAIVHKVGLDIKDLIREYLKK